MTPAAQWSLRWTAMATMAQIEVVQRTLVGLLGQSWLAPPSDGAWAMVPPLPDVEARAKRVARIHGFPVADGPMWWLVTATGHALKPTPQRGGDAQCAHTLWLPVDPDLQYGYTSRIVARSN